MNGETNDGLVPTKRKNTGLETEPKTAKLPD